MKPLCVAERYIEGMAGGRPTEYEERFCEEVIRLGGEGKITAQIAASIGVTKQCLHVWAKVHPEFCDAFTLARELAEAYHLERASQTAFGERQGNAPMAKFLLSAAFGYRETQGIDHSGHIEAAKPVTPAQALAAAQEAEQAGEV